MTAYGIDSLDPAVSPRRISVLLERLPPWARRGGEQWTVESELLAILVDHVANLTWITLRAHGAKNAPRPQPLPRPAAGSQPAAPGGSRNGTPDEAPAKTGSWMDAALALAGMPGVKVRSDG